MILVVGWLPTRVTMLCSTGVVLMWAMVGRLCISVPKLLTRLGRRLMKKKDGVMFGTLCVTVACSALLTRLIAVSIVSFSFSDSMIVDVLVCWACIVFSVSCSVGWAWVSGTSVCVSSGVARVVFVSSVSAVVTVFSAYYVSCLPFENVMVVFSSVVFVVLTSTRQCVFGRWWVGVMVEWNSMVVCALVVCVSGYSAKISVVSMLQMVVLVSGLGQMLKVVGTGRCARTSGVSVSGRFVFSIRFVVMLTVASILIRSRQTRNIAFWSVFRAPRAVTMGIPLLRQVCIVVVMLILFMVRFDSLTSIRNVFSWLMKADSFGVLLCVLC